ncbi:hypothetical protein BIFGAL_03239 [Bifidobacterium gallicum DSM 20093 = LMG 11596]|uniref:Uncharacterized protein n=1 Tax=Bifidobacterium gallicum DSM 20093 = LMG 11596 TaxID=561180 RepID=D1NTS4_9BIFI|nr:hypothetical protein BIFGAL_03239 [Bifidobacterium gallicum DSM 20093 = LMG 11596]
MPGPHNDRPAIGLSPHPCASLRAACIAADSTADSWHGFIVESVERIRKHFVLSHACTVQQKGIKNQMLTMIVENNGAGHGYVHNCLACRLSAIASCIPVCPSA